MGYCLQSQMDFKLKALSFFPVMKGPYPTIIIVPCSGIEERTDWSNLLFSSTLRDLQFIHMTNVALVGLQVIIRLKR